MSQISSNHFLKKAIENHTLIPLVGAGVSMSIKNINGDRVFPSWKELLQRATEKLQPDIAKLVNQAVDAGMLLDAAEEAKKHLRGDSWFKFLESQFDPDLNTLEQSSFDLPAALWKLSSRVMTLNYDRVLDHASGVSNLKRITNSSNATLNAFRSPADQKMIWHLHGHIDEPEKLILTFDSYKDFYVNKNEYEPAMQVLQSILATQSLLFVGCSLNDADLLAELSKQYELFSGNTAVHFALVHQDDEPLIRMKLRNLKNIEILTFSDFGQPLIDTVNEIASLKTVKNQLENMIVHQPSAAIVNKPQIAYLSAKPFGLTLGAFDAVEKELKKKPPYDIDSFTLSLENLQSLSDFNYLVLACHIKNDKLIIENEWCGSERVSLEQLEENLDLDELKGIIIICDQLPSQDALKHVNLPIIFIPELLSVNNLNNLWFQLFKKQSYLTPEKNCIICNASQFDLGEKVKSFDGKSPLKKLKLPTELSKDEVAKFIGRKQDIEEASRKLFEAKAQNECLTILGAGGLGKTSLVKKLAYEYNERNLFDCGIFFIDCEHLTSYQQFHRHIAGAFELADSVDVIEHVSENPEFRHGERLIIIDNAESLLLLSEKNKILHLLGRVNELATLIVTSRESLDIPSESTYQLRDFVADEAFELFESKAKRQFLTEEALFLKEHILKEYLDHNPLAISLVSSAMIRGKNLEELRDDLKENFFELTRKDQGSSINPEDRNIDRRSSIYNSIDYSYKHLALQSKEALIKLSYFPDGIDLVNFKKLTEQDAKSKGKAPIKDVTIKALQDKSLVQTSQHYIRLHPLVARFAKSKVNPEDEATYLQTIFEFQLSFVKSLALLGRDYNLDKQVLAKKIANTQINNFCFMLEKLSPNFNEQDIADYYGSLSSLLGRLEIYQDLYDALTLSVERFKNNTALYRLINIGRLSNEYYLGNFNLACLKLHDLLPVKNWLALDYNNNIERATFVAASAIYGNEGMEIEEAIYYKKHGIKDRCYDSALRNIGVLSQKWAQVCMKNAESLYVKWTMSELTLEELNDYFEHMHPKAHIQIAVTLTLKAKLTRLDKDEISKLVVVNPYTQGVKYLLGAMSAENTAEAKKLFKQALPELKHIKFAYTEALLEYATWLDTQGDSEFETVYNEGLASARQYHYRFLQHGFLQIKMDTKIAYNEADYPLPDDEDFSSYIKQLIGYCEKSNKLK